MSGTPLKLVLVREFLEISAATSRAPSITAIKACVEAMKEVESISKGDTFSVNNDCEFTQNVNKVSATY